MGYSKSKDITTIQLQKETRERLKRKKRGGETFDEMMRRVFRL